MVNTVLTALNSVLSALCLTVNRCIWDR